MNKRVIKLIEDEKTGDLILPIPDDMLEAAGFSIGDEVNWIDRGDGTWAIVKKPKSETEFVLVETISTMRMRYVVEVPKGKSDWALDSVTCEDVTEFSQHHIGEQIISDRVLSRQEVLGVCNIDNSYLDGWSDEYKIDRLTSKIDEDGKIVRGKSSFE